MPAANGSTIAALSYSLKLISRRLQVVRTPPTFAGPVLIRPPKENDSPTVTRDNGHICDNESILQAISKLESNIVESLTSLVNEKNVALQGKVDADLRLIEERYKAQISYLERAVSEAKQEKSHIQDVLNNKYTTEITSLREQNATLKDSIGANKEAQSVWKSQYSALKAHISELERDLDLKSKKIKDLETKNSNLDSQLKKSQNELWELKQNRSGRPGNHADDTRNEPLPEQPGPSISTTLDTTAESHSPTPPDAAQNAGKSASKSASAPPPSPPPNKDNPTKVNTDQLRRGGHLVVTSSLGRDLDISRLAPGAEHHITLKVISGGTTARVLDFIARSRYSQITTTLLVGGNDISNGVSVDDCLENFKTVIAAIHNKNPECIVNIVEVPQREGPTTLKRGIHELNSKLYDLCDSTKHCYFYHNAVDNANPSHFHLDKTHLSRKGTIRLAMVVRSAIMDGEAALQDGSSTQSMPAPIRPSGPQNNSTPGLEGTPPRQSLRGPLNPGMRNRWDNRRQDTRRPYGPYYNGGGVTKNANQRPNSPSVGQSSQVGQPSQSNNSNIHLLSELISKLLNNTVWALPGNKYYGGWSVA